MRLRHAWNRRLLTSCWELSKSPSEKLQWYCGSVPAIDASSSRDGSQPNDLHRRRRCDTLYPAHLHRCCRSAPSSLILPTSTVLLLELTISSTHSGFRCNNQDILQQSYKLLLLKQTICRAYERIAENGVRSNSIFQITQWSTRDDWVSSALRPFSFAVKCLSCPWDIGSYYRVLWYFVILTNSVSNMWNPIYCRWPQSHPGRQHQTPNMEFWGEVNLLQDSITLGIRGLRVPQHLHVSPQSSCNCFLWRLD